jgi:hypothetical protein
MAVTHSRHKFIDRSTSEAVVTAVSILKPPCGGFRSEAATWTQKWLKNPLAVGAL